MIWPFILNLVFSSMGICQSSTDPNGLKTLPRLLEECKKDKTNNVACENLVKSQKTLERAAEILVTEIGLRKYADKIGTLAAIGINKRVTLPLFHTRNYDMSLTYEIIPDVYYLNLTLPFPKKWDNKLTTAPW